MSDAAPTQDVFRQSSLRRYAALAASYSDGFETNDVVASRLNCATHLLRGWIWETDTEHRFTYMSESVLTYTGRPPKSHYGRTRQELASYHIDDEDLQRLTSQLNNREPFGPFVYQRLHGAQRYWVRTYGSPRYDDRGEFTGYQGVAQDITDEMEAWLKSEQLRSKLAKSDAILRTTIDCFPVAVSVFDADHRLELANAHFYSLLDLNHDHIGIGTRFSDIIAFLAERGEIYGGDIKAAVEERERLAASGTMHCHQRTRPNGVRLQITSIPLPGGGFVRTHADITETVELRDRLQSSMTELLRQKAIEATSAIETDSPQRPLVSRG